MSGSLATEIIPTPEQLSASNPVQSVWVSANAGSGKTHVLVDRVIRLMLSGAAPDTILCITYTKAAASEMSRRLFDRLSAWTGMGEDLLTTTLNNLGEDGGDAKLRARARQLFTRALETPGGLKIQTIHAFCERLLHLFPVEAGLSPGFRVMDERTAKELQDRASRDVRREAEVGSNEGLRIAFESLTQRLNEEQFDYLIAGFLRDIHAMGKAGLELSPADYGALLKHELGLSGDDTVDSVTTSLNAIDRAAYQSHADALLPFGPYRGRDHAALLKGIVLAESVEELLLAFYLTSESKGARVNFMSVSAIAAAPETDLFLKAERQRVLSLFKLRNSLEIIRSSMAAFALAQSILQRMEAEKHRLGLYGFDDLIARTAVLLASGPNRDWVRYKLNPGINHVLLDEAQDTSPAQWQIIRALADEFSSGEDTKSPRTLFVVGDPKQSIYSFQGADAAIFSATHLALMQRGAVASVDLTTSYRSVQDVLNVVDKVFTAEKLKEMSIAGAQDRGHAASRVNMPGRVELWPLVQDDDDDDEKNAWTRPVDRPPQAAAPRKLARTIAKAIKDWLESANPRRLLAENRALKPDDILILFQSRGPLFRMVLAELRSAGVPVAGADRLDLLKSLIVQDLLMLLHWLLLPVDDHALAIILKSPLVPEPLDDAALIPLCNGRGSENLFSRLTGDNAIWLGSLLTKREGPFALLSRVLTRFRSAIFARLGSEALEASDEMLNMAMDYQHQHGTSLFGFVQWFGATETTLKREMEKGAGEVRLMTVHGAKGLEAPIVFLADAATIPLGGRALPKIIKSSALANGMQLPVWIVSGIYLFSDSLMAWPDDLKSAAQREHDRLLYVAMTRAADELYVTGIKPRRSNPPDGCWWNTLTAALGEPQGNTRLRLPEGPDAVRVAGGSETARKQVELPAWVKPAPLERPSPRSRAATTGRYDASSAKRGRAIHRLMEELADAEPAFRNATAIKWAAQLAIPEAEAVNLAEALQVSSLAPFLGAHSAGEVDIMGDLASGERVSGRLDRLAVTPVGIWVLDYKTDRSVPESMMPNHPYARQMATYAALLEQAYPGRPVTTAIFWTQTKRLEILPNSLLTAALQESEAPAT